jgi:hypothetical protein
MDPRLQQIASYFLARRNAAEFSPQSIGPSLLPFLFVLEIERTPLGAVSALRVRLVGTALDRAFGRPLTGEALESFIHGPRSELVLETFRHCAITREPVWMRQFVYMRERRARFVEGVAVYLDPERLYGGIIVGEVPTRFAPESFESKHLMQAMEISPAK